VLQYNIIQFDIELKDSVDVLYYMELCHRSLLVYKLSTLCLARLGCLSEYPGVSTAHFVSERFVRPCVRDDHFLAMLFVKATAILS
jgi:hypothetical protein